MCFLPPELNLHIPLLTVKAVHIITVAFLLFFLIQNKWFTVTPTGCFLFDIITTPDYDAVLHQ